MQHGSAGDFGAGSFVIELDRELRIGQVDALSEKLRSVFDDRQSVSLDASRIETIDTCGLQLLAAFVRDAAGQGIALG